MSNLMRTTRYWNNLHQIRSKSIDWKGNRIKGHEHDSQNRSIPKSGGRASSMETTGNWWRQDSLENRIVRGQTFKIMETNNGSFFIRRGNPRLTRTWC
jgi:hypothetical protein